MHVVVLVRAVVVREVVGELHRKDEFLVILDVSGVLAIAGAIRVGGACDAPQVGKDRFERVDARVDHRPGVGERGGEVRLLVGRIRSVGARQIHLRPQRQRGPFGCATKVDLRRRQRRDRAVQIGNDRFVHFGRRVTHCGRHDALVLVQRQRHIAEGLDEREVVERAKEVRLAKQRRLDCRRDARRTGPAVQCRVERIDRLVRGIPRVGKRCNRTIQAAAVGIEVLVVRPGLIGRHPRVGSYLRERHELLAPVEAAQLAVAGRHRRAESIWRRVILTADTGEQLLVEVHAAGHSGDEPQRYCRKQYALHLSFLGGGPVYQAMFDPMRMVRSVGTAPPTSGSMPM